MTKTIELAHPLTTHDGTVRHLKLREPTAGDFVALGKLPMTVSGQGENMSVNLDFKAAINWLSRLTGIDDVLLGKMHRVDFLNSVREVGEYLISEDNVGNSPA